MSPRLKAFDPDEALGAAMDLFWERGYEATSMKDLVDHMQINRFSIYDTFGGKHQLFMAACEKYHRWVDEIRRECIDDAPSGLEGIHCFFDRCIEIISDPEGRRGCLVVNSAMERAMQDPELERFAQEAIGETEKALYRGLERAQVEGQLDPETDLKDLSGSLLCFLYGMLVYNKTYFDSSRLHRLKDFMLPVLLNGTKV